jgi:hypothetical protein
MPPTLIEASRRAHEWVEDDEPWHTHDQRESRFHVDVGEENVVSIELKQPLPRKDRGGEGDPESEQKFDRLVQQWRQETMFKSRAADITSHFAYYQIIGMGSKAVPLILRQVQQGEGHWFLALRALTGENPVTAEEAGNLTKMARAWVEWGKQRGLVEG